MFKKIIIWILRISAALILLQTLFFKFTAAPESVYIFSTLGVEPWGRIFSGIMELIAAVLLLYPRTTGWGAAMAAGIMAGAMASHIFKLGIEIQNDGGLLFAYAIIVFLASIILLIIHKNQLLQIFRK